MSRPDVTFTREQIMTRCGTRTSGARPARSTRTSRRCARRSVTTPTRRSIVVRPRGRLPLRRLIGQPTCGVASSSRRSRSCSSCSARSPSRSGSSSTTRPRTSCAAGWRSSSSPISSSLADDFEAGQEPNVDRARAVAHARRRSADHLARRRVDRLDQIPEEIVDPISVARIGPRRHPDRA